MLLPIHISLYQHSFDEMLKYAATAGACFALVHFAEHFRPYLYGVLFTVPMDHAALKWLMSGPERSVRCACWALKLQA